MSGPVRVGVIGVGVMGAEHARLLTREVARSAVSAVFDVDGGRAAAVAGSSGARPIDDARALITDPEVDAVLIASTDATHEALVLACLAAGKPVLCEKPLAPDVAACDRVIAAETTAGRRLVSVGFMRRFDPGYVDARSALADVGPVLMVHNVHRNATSTADDPAHLITGSAVHEIDVLRWLLDDEIATVTVHRPRASSAARTQDPLLLVLTTTTGVVADVEVFVNARYGYDVRCELVGERGTVTLDAPPATVVRTDGRIARAVPADWRPRFAEAYRRELQDWIDAVSNGAVSSSASAWDGRAATLVAQVAVRALTTGGPAAVELSARPALYSAAS